MTSIPDEEELNTQLEAVQQKITLTLQHIDQNFVRCNQIVSGEILPEVEQFAETIRSIREGYQIWVWFLEQFERPINSTSRPPFPSVASTSSRIASSVSRSPWRRLQNDLTRTTTSIPNNLPDRPPTQTAGPFSSFLSDSSLSASMPHRRFSPPHTMPFGPSPETLLKTPARQAARMMVDHLMYTQNAQSTPSDKETRDDDLPAGQATATAAAAQEKRDGDNDHGDDSFSDNIPAVDFQTFANRRREAFRNMVTEQELPRLYDHGLQSPSRKRLHDNNNNNHQSPLASTPIAEQVMADYQNYLRPTSPTPSDMSGLNSQTGLITVTTTEGGVASAAGAGGGGAGGGGGGVHREDEQGPRPFRLQDFRRTFQIPPGSTKLTHVYNVFYQRQEISEKDGIWNVVDAACLRDVHGSSSKLCI
ncbi:predicted protein [Lichtheimia corymbifera JMRC:FSU:9682]|uniref:DASH complex subunit ASK1 n=1 Tax=Lichtheimia corymbifera JMRC:FSU:9682 TaxID=1263082 RepID=A0A068RIC1_9FUNG|nr:predicted protein [Lichtheimia corymbifera JMRC:FSU:9682]